MFGIEWGTFSEVLKNFDFFEKISKFLNFGFWHHHIRKERQKLYQAHHQATTSRKSRKVFTALAKMDSVYVTCRGKYFHLYRSYVPIFWKSEIAILFRIEQEIFWDPDFGDCVIFDCSTAWKP